MMKLLRERDARGFTLIEVLIVVMIIGIIGGIAIYAIGGALTSSTRTACRTDVQTVTTAMSSYLNDHPNDLSALGTSIDIYSDTNTLVTQGYMRPLTRSAQYQLTLTISSASTYAIGVAGVGGTDSTTAAAEQCGAIVVGPIGGGAGDGGTGGGTGGGGTTGDSPEYTKCVADVQVVTDALLSNNLTTIKPTFYRTDRTGRLDFYANSGDTIATALGISPLTYANDAGGVPLFDVEADPLGSQQHSATLYVHFPTFERQEVSLTISDSAAKKLAAAKAVCKGL